VLVLLLTIAFFPIKSYANLDLNENIEDLSVVTVDFNNSRAKGLISYEKDSEGNISGPEDYAIDGRNIYILNSSDNSILKFVDGNLYDKIDIKEMKALKIACEKGRIYLLGNDGSIMCINEDNINTIIDVDEIETAAISDFKVINDVIYIITSEGDFGTTYVIDTKNREKGMISLAGHIFNNDIIYRVELLPEDNRSVGHRCKVVVMDMNSGVTKEIILKSNYWLLGAQFLGYDSEGDYRLKVFEMKSDSDFKVEVEETIQIIKEDGEVKSLRNLDKKFKSIPNQVKVFGNDIYELDNKQDKIQVLNLYEPDERTTFLYKSKLENISNLDSNVLTADQNFARASKISRSKIMSNARSFYNDFKWSCKDKNLASLYNWTKPRYVNKAGSYKCMPYCWGGFSSISDYKKAMENSGRVGNINTSSLSHVSNTYGLDCSGYVSRCWEQTTKYGTSTIKNISSKIAIGDILKGDALNNAGSHIVLFDKLDGYGNYVLYEATLRNNYDRVEHTTRSATDLSNYVPIRYNNVE